VTAWGEDQRTAEGVRMSREPGALLGQGSPDRLRCAVDDQPEWLAAEMGVDGPNDVNHGLSFLSGRGSAAHRGEVHA
jgi:hypothetical protein